MPQKCCWPRLGLGRGRLQPISNIHGAGGGVQQLDSGQLCVFDPAGILKFILILKQQNDAFLVENVAQCLASSYGAPMKRNRASNKGRNIQTRNLHYKLMVINFLFSTNMKRCLPYTCRFPLGHNGWLADRTNQLVAFLRILPCLLHEVYATCRSLLRDFPEFYGSR